MILYLRGVSDLSQINFIVKKSASAEQNSDFNHL